MDKLQIIKGGIHTDNRGSLRYFNEFSLEPVKRFYISEHPDVNIIRAWQGHKKERKWFHVIAGSFKVVLVEIDNWINPSTNLSHKEFIMNMTRNEVLSIPGGYASGFQAIHPNSRLMIFSDSSLQESLDDDFRFDKALWYKW